MLTTTPYLKPLPTISEENRPFWDGLRKHQFLVPKCQDCGDYNWVRYPACRSCYSERQEWTRVSGDATVWSFSVVHRGPGAFNAEVPYVVVLAKLAEQPRSLIVLGNLVDCPPEKVTVGMPLRVVYESIPDEDITIWRFAPAKDGS
jgi:uncharacterized OB-fold protein